MPYKTDYVTVFRKRVLYAFCTMGLIGTTVNLIGTLSGLTTSNALTIPRILNNVLLLAMFSGVIILTRRGKLELGATIFCGVGTFGTTLALLNLGETVFPALPVIYLLTIVMAATFTSPLITSIFGTICVLAYLGLNIYLISQSTTPVPVERGTNIAIFTLMLVSTTGLLAGFSYSLNRLLRDTRQQTDLLTRLNRGLQKQRNMQGNISHQIKSLTQTLDTLFEEQTSTNMEQTSLVSEVATTTQQLDAAARRIADNALSVATVAEKAQKSVELGQQAAQQSVTSIATMRERVQDINENMNTLNQQIERISEVATIIGEVADETNLLALNAAIEAAGAGEYGRRFGAIADAVQRLALRAGRAVEQIQETIAEIDQARQNALLATEQGLHEAIVGDGLVGSLALANDDITYLVDQTTTLASSIASSTQQQRTASAQIVDTIERITATAARLAQMSPQLNNVIQTLEEASDKLLRLAEGEAARRSPNGKRPELAVTNQSQQLLPPQP
jgi:methyl-accepting chemotaxis protein